MTTTGSGDPLHSNPNIPPETLALRARPQPITRINRKVLIGGAAVVLLVISALVLLALKPPSLRIAGAQELINTEHKAITEALSKLPASYEGVRSESKIAGATTPGPVMPGAREGIGIPVLREPTADPVDEAERVEKARLARMAGQARESQLFFRLALKEAPGEAPNPEARSDAVLRPGVTEHDGDLPLAPVVGAAERARALAANDLEGTADTISDQAHKLSFLKSAREKEIHNPHALQKPVSRCQLMAGTVISASLVTGLNSDLPGFVIAQVTGNVYDTVSGRYLLVPQGSRLVGKYDNVVAFGQERALVVWQRIILPDGSSILIDNLPATDSSGYAGLEDQVDQHTWKMLKGVALATVLGVGSQLAVGTSSTGDSDLVKALQQSVASTTNRAGQRLVERNLNVQPTITVRPGWPLRVIVHKDLVLRPYQASSHP
jgi:type IV secretion system protein TrbI